MPRIFGGLSLRASAGVLREFHAAGLAATADVDLRLDDHGAAIPAGDRLDLLRRLGHFASLYRQAKGSQQLLRLVFV